MTMALYHDLRRVADDLRAVGRPKRQQTPVKRPIRPYFHVTFLRNLPSIATKGLVVDQAPGLGGDARENSRGKVFMITAPGVRNVFHDLTDAAYGQGDVYEERAVPVVLRLKPQALRGFEMWKDNLARDYKGTSRYVHATIPPEGLEVWNGMSWVSVSDWQSIDIDDVVLEAWDDEAGENNHELPSPFDASPLYPPQAALS
jgi:hypothetical protein